MNDLDGFTTTKSGTTSEHKATSLIEIHRWFKEGSQKPFLMKDFRAQWESLPIEGQLQIRLGLSNGSFSY